eukprot:6301132-Karenia_brevis.AAC.1
MGGAALLVELDLKLPKSRGSGGDAQVTWPGLAAITSMWPRWGHHLFSPGPCREKHPSADGGQLGQKKKTSPATPSLPG